MVNTYISCVFCQETTSDIIRVSIFLHYLKEEIIILTS